MLKPKSPQESFYGSYLYDRIVPVDHLLRQINQQVQSGDWQAGGRPGVHATILLITIYIWRF